MLLVGTTPVGGPLLGAVADGFAARTPVVIGGVAALAVAAWGWMAARRTGTWWPRGPSALVPGGSTDDRRVETSATNA